MSLRCTISRNVGARNSYAEISLFFRTRHHGTTFSYAQKGIRRCFSSHVRLQEQLDEELQNVLKNYKDTIRPNFGSCNEITPEISDICKVDERVTLLGYLGSRRDVSKNLSFAILRSIDQQNCIQLISSSKGPFGATPHTTIKSLREWTPVLVKGKLQERNQPANDDKLLGMTLVNDREVVVESIEAFNIIPKDLIIKDDTVFPPEQRHLQLRTDSEFRKNLKFRDRASREMRKVLECLSFTEIETPLLFKSTPEGAREFLVPTRTKGLAYALPQSPQQYKQILMASGISRYFQFARCFRDEDLRADRQPEFTQLDLEMGFSAEEDVMNAIEATLERLWEQMLGVKTGRPFPRMTYQQAMASYGSDKPDMRLGSEIHSITDKLPQDLISKITPLEDPTVDAFKIDISDDPKITRKFISNFLDSPEGKPFLDNPDGQPGVFVGDAAQPQQGLGPLGYGFVMDHPEELDIEHGHLLVVQARKNQPFSGGSTSLGNLRLALHRAAVAQGLIPKPEGFKFVWIHDFPLFSPSNDTEPGQGGSAGLSSTHHPFTAPKTAKDVDLLLTAPEKVVAAHYDIVVNGVELGGGSRRIHNAKVQEFILRDVLKMSTERLEDFRHLLDVLRSGCPPHAGLALGWDRLIAVMLGKDSVRDVIAFPKSGRGEDMLVKSPNPMTKTQLDTYHLQLKD
ncbi:aspartyl-tRNA synthetase-like protein [Dendryphion nanum]|uniref:Aspartyl-tRNA synthetase-like protein n=1 Tax=Dendryphion nanum TaxID=256645 RepID=A0A9P9DXW5_9PLEO|nr:aspartyl-tRNA synthetase-like protein [Dendryphion nanum]